MSATVTELTELTPLPLEVPPPFERRPARDGATMTLARREHAADGPRPSLLRTLGAHGAQAGAVDAFLEALPIGVAMIDARGHLVYANAAARALAAIDLPAVRRTMAHAMVANAPCREERLECRTPTGTRRWLDVTVVPVPGLDDEIAAALLTIADVTSCVQATDWRPIIETLARL